MGIRAVLLAGGSRLVYLLIDEEGNQMRMNHSWPYGLGRTFIHD